eukprot:CAMPEP_0196784518 /NCGR_PEP_ID=MMETSP1104-20130614/17159_1 /TAXON_ID=33652 /ORGANISM="Cafeteria sp., Strain Caron Lab Isolate" /LENGTH=87 /DNA_ID=CAMNT_0042154803 /DNA_START=12 /DNA_END=272 /DNA_ORIENTATION=-
MDAQGEEEGRGVSSPPSLRRVGFGLGRCLRGVPAHTVHLKLLAPVRRLSTPTRLARGLALAEVGAPASALRTHAAHPVFERGVRQRQ